MHEPRGLDRQTREIGEFFVGALERSSRAPFQCERGKAQNGEQLLAASSKLLTAGGAAAAP
jgi:hypothetical protein